MSVREKVDVAPRPGELPYEFLRRARKQRELLQHADKSGLDGLMNDYLALADELEPETSSGHMPVADVAEGPPSSSRAA